MADEEEHTVFLQCLADGSRLRVRIISPNYFNDLNCQFPRQIRKEGRVYKVKPSQIKLMKRPGTDFYSIKQAKDIIIVDEEAQITKVEKIFQDESTENCCICLDEKKYYVFSQCGHYYVCKSCYDSSPFEKCPICRSVINAAIPVADLNL